MGVIIKESQRNNMIPFSGLSVGDTFFVICNFKPIYYIKMSSETTVGGEANAVNLGTGTTAYFLASDEVRRVKIEGRVIE